ncbi:MAG: ferrous iron transport protein A [Firmicutes bacterium]|jgi:Fe2+ transport system protein FeoA|nr:ferrous iron transport protein A [Bacillota bacterium]MDH7496348.1 FeoA family protein [Bacillota bacterium]
MMSVASGGARIIRVRRDTISQERGQSTRPLAALNAGDRGRVVRVNSASAPLLQKLLAMAVLPGSEVRVNLTFPVFVLETDNTRVAVDRAIAAQILVEPAVDSGRRLDGTKG